MPFTAEQSDFLSERPKRQPERWRKGNFPSCASPASIHGDERLLSVPLNFDCLMSISIWMRFTLIQPQQIQVKL